MITLDSEILKSLVKKIIDCSNPEKIILFGSAAKGTMKAGSDYDFLVIMKNGINRRKTSKAIYKSIMDIDFAADIVVVTEEDVELYKDKEWNVISPAVKEGKVLYAA